jgi:iron complex outermembrane receptor protein
MTRNRQSRPFAAHLLACTAFTSLLAAGHGAMAQQSATQQAAQEEGLAVEEVVVTGTSIRGVAPVGSNLISLGSQAVLETGAATTQELFATVPQLATFNTAPRPDQRSNGTLSTAPNIRGIGQAQTLVLINGHRLVGVGHLQNIPDPSIVPPSAISRVEIIADGASSIYGSDGIAGVVNLITLRDYDGFQASARYGVGKNYDLFNTNAVTGRKWDGGGYMLSVEYSRTSNLYGGDRVGLFSNDFSAQGGRDNRNIGTNCSPSTYRNNATATGGAAGSYFQPATGVVDPRCVNYQSADLYPEQDRLSFMSAGHQKVTDNIELYYDAFYSKTSSESNRGPLYANGVMTRSNPYFPTGVAAGVPSITTYFNVNNLIGIPEIDTQDLKVYGFTIGGDVDLPRDFRWSTYWTGSESVTDLREPSFNSGALGQLLQSSDPTTAIDPFNGRTSAASKITLADWEQSYQSDQSIWEINTKIDGPLFALPGGDVKVAVGGVHRVEFFDGLFTNGRKNFLEGVGAQKGTRKVWSAFGELFVPVVGEANARPGVYRLDLSLSARYDSYNDFGDTTNPKIGVNYAPIQGLTLRGSYGTSFHAPALPDLYGPDTRAGYNNNGTAPPGFIAADVPGGIFIAGGNDQLKAEKADTWSLGVDFVPDFLPGFRSSLTYYNIDFKGRVAFPNGSFFYRDPAFNPYFVANNVCTNGAVYNPAAPDTVNCRPQPIPAQQVWDLIKDLPLQSFPRTINGPADLPPIYTVTILRRANLAQILTDGLDFDASYRWTMGDTALSAQANGNYVLSYDQRAAAGAAIVDQFPFGQPKLRLRGQLSATQGPFNGVVAVNYSHKYENQYNLPTNVAAVEKIDAYTTMDLHLGYKLPPFTLLPNVQLTLDVDNVFDADLPRARAGNGYGNGNILGRTATIGIRAKF